ncbi:MAG: COQ9 family protein [Alphaproteobacteria bacterium]
MSEFEYRPLDYLTPVRQAVLAAALPHVPFDGWSERAFQTAVLDAGVDAGLALLAFPDGVMDLLDAFWGSKDHELAQEIARRGLHNTHLSQRISEALKIYIALLRPHREAVRRALALQALPLNAPGAVVCLYRTVDVIWRSVGDTSTDFNFYTKRATLTLVVGSVVTHWLGESGQDVEAMDDFIGRRIENVLAFEKVKARISAMMQHLPSPVPLLGRLAGRVSGIRRSP